MPGVKMKLFWVFLMIGLPFWGGLSMFGQNGGFKYFKNYSHKGYARSPQNWCVLQDKRGIIYVANQGGVLEFDGVYWRTLEIPNQSVRSMAINDKGTIYIGGKSELGFLARDSNGFSKYVSLLDQIKDSQRNFSNVWRINSTQKEIYFRTTKLLFRWDTENKKMKVWKAIHQFNASSACYGKFFIHDKQVGLMHILGDSLKLIPGGEIFVNKRICLMVPYEEQDKTGQQRILVGTRSNGFFIYNGLTARPFPTEADDYLKEKQFYHGIRLFSPDFGPGELALATILGGLVILDCRGKLLQIFDKASGLLDNDVKYVSQDSQGNLWLALNKGISKIEYASPISIYDERSNLPGLVLSVVRDGPHQNLYAGTTAGLFLITPSSRKFRPVRGMTNEYYCLLPLEDSLLAASPQEGVVQVRENVNLRVISNPSYILLRSQRDPQRIWVGTFQGLVSLYRGNNGWEKENTFKTITEKITTIVENKTGNLWLGTLTKGVLKVNFSSDEMMNPVVSRYHTSEGLPPGEVHVFMAAGHVTFAAKRGLYRFNPEAKTFSPDLTLGEEFANGSRNVFRIAEDKNKNIWFHSRLCNFHAVPRADGSFVVHSIPFARIPSTQVNAIYPDKKNDGDITWFASNDGLLGYHTKLQKNYSHDFSTLIRQVVVNGRLMIEGCFYEGHSNIPLFNIDYKDRNLRFRYSAPFFEAESVTRYQFFLEGYDSGWSGWTLETQKDYTNLDSGRYNFRVRARNVYGHLSGESIFRFRVFPPWYKTWWALLLYGVLIFLLMFLVVKWRSHQLEKEKQKLEQIVEERTIEIQERTEEIKDKNQQLQKQTLQLQEQSQKLREMDQVKSRFFANISHEFRTPLTLIMGPLEQMLSNSYDKRQKTKLEMMLRNSQRLLTLINQLLDLSRIDSGRMKLQAGYQNIVSFLSVVVDSFHSLAEQHQLDFQFTAPPGDIALYFDSQKLEEVMYNLLINAVKFTPPGGKIIVTVQVKTIPTYEESVSSGFLEISVRDTGIGIPNDQLAHIFDRFYQVEGSKNKTLEHGYKGTGIGLALARELVCLHHGEIDVHSGEGKQKGTEFIIRLPMGKKHLKPEEITDLSLNSFHHALSGKIPAFQMKDDEVSQLEAAPAVSEEEKDQDREKRVILVVEDNVDVRAYIREPLESQYTVAEAREGQEGIQKAREIIPDLIISDIMMPGADGYELCQVLKTDIKTSHIPIILLTAKASEESIVQGLETGADDYITKPFNTKILVTRIKNLIELRRQLQEKFQRQMVLQPAEISVSSIDQKFIEELQDLIEKNLSDPDFNVEALSNKMDISRVTLNKKMQALTGQSPNEFIRSYRLKRGAQLLKANFGNVTDVTFEVGFSSTAYFTRCFKEKFHQLPSAFQASEASTID
jgi:signal transduction histidine kinase/DNA-binding NarL/FixJ family response regulator